jgi:hypothetical protein
MSDLNRYTALKLAAVYWLAGGVWIFLSDRLPDTLNLGAASSASPASW